MPNCPFLTLGAKLSAVPNCPFTLLVPNCPRCQIVLVPNCPRTWGGGIFDIDVSMWEVVIDEGDQIQ